MEGASLPDNVVFRTLPVGFLRLFVSQQDGCHLINKSPECSSAYCEAVAKIITFFRTGRGFEWSAHGKDFGAFGLHALQLVRGMAAAMGFHTRWHLLSSHAR